MKKRVRCHVQIGHFNVNEYIHIMSEQDKNAIII